MSLSKATGMFLRGRGLSGLGGLPLKRQLIQQPKSIVRCNSTFSKRQEQDLFWKGAAIAGLLGIAGICLYGQTAAERPADPFLAEATSRIAHAYGYVAGGLGVTALTAMSVRRTPFAYRLMSMNPWVFTGVSFVGLIGSMIGTQMVDFHDNPLLKHACFVGFTGAMGLSLVPLTVIAGPVLGKAAMATGAIVGSLSTIAACAPNESFLWMGGVCGIGLGAVVAAGFAGMIFPGSALLYNVSVYGGLGVFSLLMLYDTQRLIEHSKRDVAMGARSDPINASMGIYMNTINIFVRMVTILSNMQGNRRR